MATRESSSSVPGSRTPPRWSTSSSSEATVLKLVLEYDGTEFGGWAAQPGIRTVEGELTNALETIRISAARISVAGRTDAGVHAWGQVCSVETGGDIEPQRLARSLNAVLPSDVAVRSAEAAPDGFDARRDARSRTYCYRVFVGLNKSPFERNRSLWWPHGLDEDLLAECAASLYGSHDFTAFTPTQTDHVRFERDVMRSEWLQRADTFEFWIEADTFMRHMVRILVGTMLDVATGRRSADYFVRLLDGAPRSAAGPTTEPYGLYLASVRY